MASEGELTSLVGTTVADCLSAFSEKATQSSHRSTPLQKPSLSPAMMLPHSDLLLFVHGPPVPEEGAVAQHAGVALRPVLGLEKERGATSDDFTSRNEKKSVF